MVRYPSIFVTEARRTLRVPQRHRRIDPRGSPGRSCGRHRRGHRHQDRHHRERDEVQRLHAEQHRADQPAEHRRQDQADDRAGGDDAKRARHHEPQHIARRRTKRAAHPEITHPLLDRIREDPEHADHRQRDRERREGRHHHRPEPVPSGGRPLDVLERHDIANADQLLLVDP